MSIFKRIFLIFLIGGLIVLTSCKEQQPTKRTSFEYNNMISHGVNMGNALEAPVEGSWGVFIDDEYFKLTSSPH